MPATSARTVPFAAALALCAAIAGHPALTAPDARAQAPTAVTGSLWVEGGSTVRSWDCAASRFQVDVTRADGVGDGLSLDGLGEAVSAFRVRVPTAALDCDDNTMNGHMRDALDTKSHEVIELRMERYRVLDGTDGTEVELVGSLQIKGRTRPATLRARVESGAAGLRVRGVHTLNMTDFGVKPPRLMFGALRVHEEVEVHFDLLMTPSDG